MHILLAILAIAGGAAFWWWRFKQVGEAASDVADVAGRAWGKYKRKKFLSKVHDSPLAVIDDPATAAVILMHVVAMEDGKLGPAIEEEIKQEVTNTLGITDSMEIITFGKWTASHATDSKSVMLRYTELWTSHLSNTERFQLVGMVENVMKAGGAELSSEQRARLTFLRQRLGIQVH